jgi:hypothetical protein
MAQRSRQSHLVPILVRCGGLRASPRLGKISKMGEVKFDRIGGLGTKMLFCVIED